VSIDGCKVLEKAWAQTNHWTPSRTGPRVVATGFALEVAVSEKAAMSRYFQSSSPRLGIHPLIPKPSSPPPRSRSARATKNFFCCTIVLPSGRIPTTTTLDALRILEGRSDPNDVLSMFKQAAGPKNALTTRSCFC
jgi:hypothetical protein